MSKKRRLVLIIYIVALSFILVTQTGEEPAFLERLHLLMLNKKEVRAAEVTSTCTERMLLEGTEAATELIIVTSFKEGPTVMVIGGVHGDEPAGFMAAEGIATWAIDSGTLLVLPHANVCAIAEKNRTAQEGDDLNRAFPGAFAGNDESCTTELLAGAIYQVMVEFAPEWVIDLHEAENFEYVLNGALGQTFICPKEAGAEDIIKELLTSVNRTIILDDYSFTLLHGVAPGSAVEAAGFLGANALIIETCKRMPLDERIKMHRQVVSSLLYLLGITVY